MAWLTGWDYRKKLTINGESATTETNIVFRVVANYGTGTDSGHEVYLNSNSRTDFGDVRFTASDGETELDYFFESFDSSNLGLFWVKIPSIPATPGDVDIFLYYGNSSASTTSNPQNTYVEFEGFESTPFSLDTGSMTLIQNADGLTGSHGARTDESSDSHRVIYQNVTDYDLRDYFIELAAKWPTNSGNNNRNLVGGILAAGQNSGNDGYQIILDPRGSDSVQIRRDTNFNTRTNGNFSAVVNTWYLLKAYMTDASTLRAELWSQYGDVNHGTTTRSSDTPYTTGRHGLYSFTQDNNSFDNLRVRPRPGVDPTVGAWGAEEEPPSAELVIGPFPTFFRPA